jgi:hypothetical protein
MSSVRSHDRDGQGIVTAASPREHLTDRPADAYALLEMHAAMSPDNSYLRFFNYSRLSAEHEAERLCLGDTGRGAKPGRVALLALAGGLVCPHFLAATCLVAPVKTPVVSQAHPGSTRGLVHGHEDGTGIRALAHRSHR